MSKDKFYIGQKVVAVDDEVAVMQMEYIVEQIITDPSRPVEMPEYF